MKINLHKNIQSLTESQKQTADVQPNLQAMATLKRLPPLFLLLSTMLCAVEYLSGKLESVVLPLLHPSFFPVSSLLVEPSRVRH